MTRGGQRVSLLVAALALLFIGTGVLQAQTATGQVAGVVTDQTGARVSSAEVTLQNLATNIESKTSSNRGGSFTFPNVPPGQYSLRVELAGFKAARITEFTVGVNQSVEQDIV